MLSPAMPLRSTKQSPCIFYEKANSMLPQPSRKKPKLTHQEPHAKRPSHREKHGNSSRRACRSNLLICIIYYMSCARRGIWNLPYNGPRSTVTFSKVVPAISNLNCVASSLSGSTWKKCLQVTCHYERWNMLVASSHLFRLGTSMRQRSLPH